MRIKPDHQATYERLLIEQANKRGFATLNDYIKAAREAVKFGKIKPHWKCEATYLFSFLNHGELLKFACDTLYEYVNDTHIATLDRALFAKHANQE